MAPRYTNVIVFGATGDVGRSVALESQKRGARVHLGMRDTSKSINPELDDAQTFSRITADLSDPSSVKAAIEATGATAAFIYHVFTDKDTFAASLRALKDAGVVWTVFLSSYTLKKDQDLRKIPQSEFIPYVHATIEAQLEDLNMPHAALRPGNFASNNIRQNLNTSKDPPEAEVINAALLSDCIVPRDIGRVGGAVLVDGPSDSNKEIIYLYGPQLLTTDETWDVLLANCPGASNVKVMHPGVEEIVRNTVAKGYPEAISRSIIEHQANTNGEEYYAEGLHEIGVSNIKKYSGYEPTGFKEYITTQRI